MASNLLGRLGPFGRGKARRRAEEPGKGKAEGDAPEEEDEDAKAAEPDDEDERAEEPDDEEAAGDEDDDEMAEDDEEEPSKKAAAKKPGARKAKASGSGKAAGPANGAYARGVAAGKRAAAKRMASVFGNERSRGKERAAASLLIADAGCENNAAGILAALDGFEVSAAKAGGPTALEAAMAGSGDPKIGAPDGGGRQSLADKMKARHASK